MIAWVLIFGLGYSWSFTVSNIYSEASCNDLGKRIQKEWVYYEPTFKCYSYQVRSNG